MGVFDEGVFARDEVCRSGEDACDARAFVRHAEWTLSLAFERFPETLDLLPLQMCDKVFGRTDGAVRRAPGVALFDKSCFALLHRPTGFSAKAGSNKWRTIGRGQLAVEPSGAVGAYLRFEVEIGEKPKGHPPPALRVVIGGGARRRWVESDMMDVAVSDRSPNQLSNSSISASLTGTLSGQSSMTIQVVGSFRIGPPGASLRPLKMAHRGIMWVHSRVCMEGIVDNTRAF